MGLMEMNRGEYKEYNHVLFDNGEATKPLESSNQPTKNAALDTEVGTIMTTEIATVTKKTDLMQAWKEMAKLKIHHLPVVGESGSTLEGLISDRDLARIGEQIQEFTARDVMTNRVITATPLTSIRDILQAMVNERISSVPIVGDQYKLVGIVTDTDLLAFVLENC